MKRYQAYFDLDQVRDKFKDKLVGDGLDPDRAKAAAYDMSKGDLEQVHKDLKRHPKILVVNKLNGMVINVSSDIFNDESIVQYFVDMIACEDKELFEYFSQFLHQGGFLHLSELLTAYYFAPDTRFETDNRVATFTLEENGEMSYEEKFDITKVINNDTEYQSSNNESIATISLKSTFSKDEDNTIKHRYHNMKVQVNDKVAENFFNDPRGKFQKFLKWIKDTVSYIFDEAHRNQEKQRNRIAPSSRKM